jgi:hypothetical protein
MTIQRNIGPEVRRVDEDVAIANIRNGEELAKHLENRVQETLAEVEAADCWRRLMDPATPLPIVRDVLAEVYLEIAMYQPDAIEAAVAAIAQMPRDMPVQWFDDMLHHQVEEFDHGEMAIRDFVGLGGSEEYARNRRQSPSAFAVAAVWRNIAHKRDPFLYLGAVYLFDGLTPIVTAKALQMLAGRFASSSGFEFITHHATADIAHTAAVRELIVAVANRYPHTIPSIALGYEYFAHVYPLPCWNAATQRALARHQAR